ncbi:MAG: Na/Pi cotransporter family protein [Spirochaetales bacterium]|nr:Na/Pi cotransporter family protein [Spirochaetales bacterium]
MVFITIFNIMGSLGLFLFGMKIMSDGIQKAAGRRLQAILKFMTGNRFLAVLTGFLVTGLIQSSSATTVMVVGFVNAGLLTLKQAIGVIMGANIGTTVTGWIVAIVGFKVKIAVIALPALAIGLPLRLNTRLGKQDWGEACTGLGLLFLGLEFLKSSIPSIQDNPEILHFLANFTDLGAFSFLIFVAVGTIVTIIVQSSSAAMAITLTMAYSGWIDFPTAAAIVLGENIGTTATAFIASIGTNVSARRASRAHTLFNVFGVLWMAFLIKPFLALVDLIVPGSAGTGGGITAHLAMFHTLFNLVNTSLCIGFVGRIEALVKKLVKVHKGEEELLYQLKYISAKGQDTAELNIANAKLELSRMAGLVGRMFDRFLLVFKNPDKKMGNEVESVKRMEDYTDRMQEDISAFLARCAQQSLNQASANNVNAMIRIAHELETIGDSCFNLMILAQRRYEGAIVLPETALIDLQPYTKVVSDFIDFITERLNRHLSQDDLEAAFRLERTVNDYRNRLKDEAQERLSKGSEVKSELLYIEIVRQIEQIGDQALNVAQALRQIR